MSTTSYHSQPVALRSLCSTGCAALLLALSGSGCAYLTHRGQDALDMMDVGITFSAQPQFAAYASAPGAQILTLGFGRVDGRFVGVGEGRAALWGPHYESSVGLLLWGEERISYRRTGAELAALPPQEADLAANFMRVGPAGFVHGPAPSLKYVVSCPHYIHLGWIGVVATPRWLQMADFLAGWVGLDLCLDDGARRDTPGGFRFWRGINPGGRPTGGSAPGPAASPRETPPPESEPRRENGT